MDNSKLIEYVKEITVAKMSSWTNSASAKNGDETADFMQKIYDKLSELSQKGN